MVSQAQAFWAINGWGVLLFVLIVFLVWRLGTSQAGFIGSLNAINSQVWAFLILASGIAAVLLFHKAGIAIDIAAGVIGAAVNMFNSLIKPQPLPGAQHLEVDSTPPAKPIVATLNGQPIPNQSVEPPKEGV